MKLDSLEIDYKNLERIHLSNIIKFKPNEKSNLSSNFFISLGSSRDLYLQFKINYKFMDNIEIILNDKKYKLLESIPDGILINCFINKQNKIKIKLSPIDYCANINIWDIQLFEINEFEKITWDKIYIINLERRQDRKNDMMNKLEKIGLKNYEFVNAVDGQKDKIKNAYEKLKNGGKTRISSPGHFGCSLSHIKVLKKAKEKGYKQIMVLEDDIEFIEDFVKKLQEIVVPKFDLLYLGGPTHEYKLFTESWGKHKEIMGTYGYIIKSELYDDLIKFISRFKYTIDITLIEFVQSKYEIILLDDMVKTKIDDSDTSVKNNLMNLMVSRLNSIFYQITT